MLPEGYSFTPLDFLTTKNYFNDKFIIFASFCRHSCRSLYDFYVIGLATGGAWLNTRLFLFIQLTIKRLRDTVFIPVKLIKEANEQNWLRELAYFVRMKSLYVNNTHYGYNLRSLGERLNCTPSCLSHYIKHLKHRDLIVQHSGNMTFRGWKKLRSMYGDKFIGVPVDHENQLNLLRAQIIRFNLSSQNYHIKRTGVQKCQPSETPDIISERFNSCYTGLSAHGFGRVLGVSKSQGALIRKNLVASGILLAVRRYGFFVPSGGPFGGTPSAGALRAALIQMKTAGTAPPYAFVKNGHIMVERRMELEYCRA
jgi:hypothetical protein